MCYLVTQALTHSHPPVWRVKLFMTSWRPKTGLKCLQISVKTVIFVNKMSRDIFKNARLVSFGDSVVTQSDTYYLNGHLHRYNCPRLSFSSLFSNKSENKDSEVALFPIHARASSTR